MSSEGSIAADWLSDVERDSEGPRSVRGSSSSQVGIRSRAAVATPSVFRLFTDWEDVYVRYTHSRILNGGPEISGTGLADILGRFGGEEYAVAKKCVMSLATTYYGHQHRNTEIIRSGSQLYGQALKELNAALRDPIRSKSSEVTTSIILLGLYEVRQSWNLLYDLTT